jgi:hypothetical protein
MTPPRTPRVCASTSERVNVPCRRGHGGRCHAVHLACAELEFDRLGVGVEPQMSSVIAFVSSFPGQLVQREDLKPQAECRRTHSNPDTRSLIPA